MSQLADRLQRVHQRIHAAETRFQRPPGSVRLLAVSKKHPTSAILEAMHAGQVCFGESYLQEALDKMQALENHALEWHFIGRIQRNKTARIAEVFDWVHGLCDIQHARRLSDQRPDQMPPLKVCVQINLDQDPAKAGLAPSELADFLQAVEPLPGISLQGLMTLPAAQADEDAARVPFRQLRELRDAHASADCPLPELSMGMSDDLEAAIAEGSTLVRIGTAIFGPRDT